MRNKKITLSFSTNKWTHIKWALNCKDYNVQKNIDVRKIHAQNEKEHWVSLQTNRPT